MKGTVLYLLCDLGGLVQLNSINGLYSDSITNLQDKERKYGIPRRSIHTFVENKAKVAHLHLKITHKMSTMETFRTCAYQSAFKARENGHPHNRTYFSIQSLSSTGEETTRPDRSHITL